MTTPTPSNPLVDLLAGWEDKNGTMAAIMPHEWAELMRPVMNACMYQSPRQIRSDLAASDAELKAARLFIAEVGHSLPDQMYIETVNREGLAEDCKRFATGEVCAKYLDVKWQTDRAIAAERKAEESARVLAEIVDAWDNGREDGSIIASRRVTDAFNKARAAIAAKGEA